MNLYHPSLWRRSLLLLPSSRWRRTGLALAGMLLLGRFVGSIEMPIEAGSHSAARAPREVLKTSQSAPVPIAAPKTAATQASAPSSPIVLPNPTPAVVHAVLPFKTPEAAVIQSKSLGPEAGSKPPAPAPALGVRAPELRSFTARRTEEGGAEIGFSTHLLFEPGTARLTPQGENRLLDLISQVRSSGYSGSEISVHGHTDDSPVIRNRGLYATNWELSGARAFAIVRLFEREGFDPTRLMGAGHGQWKPVLPNRDLEGLPYADHQVENRRVIIRLSTPIRHEERGRIPASEPANRGQS